MTRVVSMLALAAILAAPAGAVTFSFASDDNHDGPTFQGNSGGSMPDDLSEGSALSVDSLVNVDLMVDVNDDKVGGVVIYQAVMTFGGSIDNITSVARGAGWVHTWDVSDGAIDFTQLGTGTPILSIVFDSAILTTYSPTIFNTGETLTLQTSADVDSAIAFITYPILQGIGVGPLQVSASEDFAFTFTHARKPAGGLPVIHHGVFLGDWISEGSFSAHAAKGEVSEVPVE